MNEYVHSYTDKYIYIYWEALGMLKTTFGGSRFSGHETWCKSSSGFLHICLKHSEGSGAGIRTCVEQHLAASSQPTCEPKLVYAGLKSQTTNQFSRFQATVGRVVSNIYHPIFSRIHSCASQKCLSLTCTWPLLKMRGLQNLNQQRFFPELIVKRRSVRSVDAFVAKRQQRHFLPTFEAPSSIPGSSWNAS